MRAALRAAGRLACLATSAALSAAQAATTIEPGHGPLMTASLSPIGLIIGIVVAGVGLALLLWPGGTRSHGSDAGSHHHTGDAGGDGDDGD